MKKLASVSLLLASLVLVGAGCGQKPSVSVKAPGAANPAPALNPGAATSDACGNPYYPFKPGLTIAYGVTPFAKVAGDTDYVIRTVSVTGTAAVFRAEMAGGVKTDVEANCAGGSVEMKGTFGLGATAQGMKVKVTVVSSNGTFMPADVSAGTTWSNSQTVKMDSTGGSAAVTDLGPITITTAERSRAIAEESVTVPAGTYKAIKVELTRTSTSEFSGPPPGAKLPPGMKLPAMPPSTWKSTEWWVKGIGMVKTVTTGQDGTTTVVAKSVTGL